MRRRAARIAATRSDCSAARAAAASIRALGPVRSRGISSGGSRHGSELRRDQSDQNTRLLVKPPFHAGDTLSLAVHGFLKVIHGFLESVHGTLEAAHGFLE